MNANRERFPTTGAGATAKVTLRLTRGELLALDRFCAERLLTRSHAAGLAGGFSTLSTFASAATRVRLGETGLATPRR